MGYGMSLSDRLFEQFSELVHKECGINLHEGKKALLQARLSKRLRATGLHSYENYYRYLTSDAGPQEMIHFLDCISTNLTYFFRESQHFEFIDGVMPDLLERKRREGTNRIRVWSAGCSTGEEPYSLAMTVLSRLDDPRGYDLKILATDISTRALAVAAKGVYAEEKVQKIAPALRNRYFRKIESGGGRPEYQVCSDLGQIVTFRRLNLNEAYPFKGPFDFIFCRNVMIYFDKATQEALVKRIAHYLDSEGYLFVGHSESLMGLKHPLSYACPAIYRK